MTNSFTYSVLQYHHSLILGEAINVGILFFFPQEEKLHFVSGNTNRLKSIYPDFDQTVYNYLTRSISSKLKLESNTIFSAISSNDLKKIISSYILPEDATALQFQEPVNVLLNQFNTENGKIIEEFSNLLLPGIITPKTEVRHNEYYLIKRFTDILSEKHKDIDKKLIKNQILKTTVNNREIEMKIDFAWQNGSTNIVKPLSFDLTEEKNIQDKSLVNYGYLNLLGGYATANNYRFDFIVSQPQKKSLFKSYENAIGLLELSNAPKRIILESELLDYSLETIEHLLNH